MGTAAAACGFSDMEVAMPKPIIKSPTDARAGSKEGVVRYVLGISLALVVILFIIGYMIS
jgi:hypothetical protein